MRLTRVTSEWVTEVLKHYDIFVKILLLNMIMLIQVDIRP
jgi:hypothetical protein